MASRKRDTPQSCCRAGLDSKDKYGIIGLHSTSCCRTADRLQDVSGQPYSRLVSQCRLPKLLIPPGAESDLAKCMCHCPNSLGRLADKQEVTATGEGIAPIEQLLFTKTILGCVDSEVDCSVAYRNNLRIILSSSTGCRLLDTDVCPATMKKSVTSPCSQMINRWQG